MSGLRMLDGLSDRARDFLASAAMPGGSIDIECRGEVTSKPQWLGRNIALVAFASALSIPSPAVNDETNLGARISPPDVSVDGVKISIDPYLQALRIGSSEVSVSGPTRDHETDSVEFIKELAYCTPGLSDTNQQVLLRGYLEAHFGSDVSRSEAEKMHRLGITFKEIQEWAEQNARQPEIALAAYCHYPQDWRSQIEKWDAKARVLSGLPENSPTQLQDAVLDYRLNLYAGIAQAKWEYQANVSVANQLKSQGLMHKVSGDIGSWVSAISSVGQGVASLAGSRRGESVVSSASRAGSSVASSYRSLEQVGSGQSRVDQVYSAGRALSDVARTIESGIDLVESARSSGDRTANRPYASRTNGAYRDQSTELRLLSQEAYRSGMQISLAPLAGQPLPTSHPSVLLTQSRDIQRSSEAARRNLEEVIRLNEHARAAGLRINFDAMFAEYGQLSDRVTERQRGMQHEYRGVERDRPRG